MMNDKMNDKQAKLIQGMITRWRGLVKGNEMPGFLICTDEELAALEAWSRAHWGVPLWINGPETTQGFNSLGLAFKGGIACTRMYAEAHFSDEQLAMQPKGLTV